MDVAAPVRSGRQSRPIDPPATAAFAEPTTGIAAPAIIAGAWAIILAGELTGWAAALHHHALIEGGPPLWLAAPSFLAAWLVMVAAMMLPASLPTIRDLRGDLAPFLAGFALVWAAFGAIAFLGDVLVHHLVDASPWLAGRPWLIEAAILAVAGGYQLTPLKRRRFAARDRSNEAMVAARPPMSATAALGVRHGLDGLGSTWALMLVMFGEGFASLWWMIALTAIMVNEATGGPRSRVPSAVGLLLLLTALSKVT